MPRTRSPNFPAINLERALAYTETLYDAAQRHQMPLTAAMTECWELTPTSSTAKQAAGALRSFGLIEVEGKGVQAKARVTEDAVKILENHPDRGTLLLASALLPRVHAAVWQACGGADGLAPDSTIHNFLLFDHDPPFNKPAIPGFIKQLRETLSFATAEANGIVPGNEEGGDDGEPEPVVPLAEVETTDPPKVDTRNAVTPPPPSIREQPGMNQNTLQLDEGSVILQFPASISAESYEDLKDWLELMGRRVQRAVASPVDPASTALGDEPEPE